jgi:DNA segregation ATPase FtsK/SpoIIIE, S-DNA-T family
MTAASEEFPPVLAGWLKNRSEFTETVSGGLRRTAHRSGWHGVRLPLYLVRLALMSPRGLYRTLRALHNILFDGESRALRAHHVDRLETKEFVQLRKLRDQRVRNRLVVAAVLSIPLLVGGVLAWFLVPSWSLWAAAVTAVELLGWVGRPIDKPIARPATLVNGAPGPLRAPFVMEALCSLGVGGMKDPAQIGLLFDVARVGPGYQVDLELPRGVAATAVIEKREQLSAALRRELGCVWPSVGPRHQGHLRLYVADEPMATARQARWPLLKSGQTNIFAPMPAFTDQRGRWVAIELAYTSGVIGAVPRMGKTVILRELLLIAGLDPRTKVYAIDLKGTGDLAPCALFAHFYAVGDEDEEITAVLRALRDLRQEMRRRAKVLRALPHDRCPENKVTSELADDRSLGLEPVFVGVDECQTLLDHEDKAVRQEAVALCTDLVKRGPALGIMCYFATQKPDAKSIPSAIADNAVVRICLKVSGQISNDQILGTSSYHAGLRATVFAFEDKGVAYLKSDGSDAKIVRSVAGLDAPTAEKVANRARQARQAVARLTGMAAGQDAEHEAQQVRLLDDVRQVFVGAPAMHLGDLVAGLANLRPALYGHLDPASLAGMLRSAGVRVESVYVADKIREESSRKGVKVEWLDVAVTAAIGEEAEAYLRERAES